MALLLVASWPFLNVWGMGLKGGLRVSETFSGGVSLLFITALLTLAVLDQYAYDRIDERLEGQSPAFVSSITNTCTPNSRLWAGRSRIQ